MLIRNRVVPEEVDELNRSGVKNGQTLSTCSSITNSTTTSSTVVRILYQIHRIVHRVWILIHPRDQVETLF